MRVCRTARRGIFRFKFSYCDRGILRSRLLKALAAQDFHEDAAAWNCSAVRIQSGGAQVLALQCKKFAPLRNDKIYGALASRQGLFCSASVLRADFAADDKI
ncbi:hypothetical protein [uncultured Campylobacter sp.]|uniref:hypothetical protein n=1 Tax=uncultured Campylobacter sp. TaxID=218934 RepID=UPI0026064054|nr:hypothetical protein [uncultured Campylobacter sp.]